MGVLLPGEPVNDKGFTHLPGAFDHENHLIPLVFPPQEAITHLPL
jgi:hypothetical protein